MANGLTGVRADAVWFGIGAWLTPAGSNAPVRLRGTTDVDRLSVPKPSDAHDPMLAFGLSSIWCDDAVGRGEDRC